MKVLVVGKGGREHALVRALSLSASVSEVHAFPGSAGMATEALCHRTKDMSFESLLKIVKDSRIDLVVIGPEDQLVQGWADDLRKENICVVGPSKEAAQLEGSKVFAKEFMKSAGVPTAAFKIVSTTQQTLELSTQFTPPYVLKADGLAAGKGVFICKDRAELESAARYIFEDKGLGTAGDTALLEQYQPGWELSYLVLTNGVEYQALPLAQDHKRLREEDKGPNTGGMGVVAPLKIDEALRAEINKNVIEPSIRELEKREYLFRGVLYVGLMITDSGPQVLEYNARFGDPEAQVLLPLLDGDWGEVFWDLAKGELQNLRWKSLSSACVVLAAEGYPEAPKKNVEIKGDIKANTASSYFLHAGTDKTDSGKWVTNGGRVLNALGIGSSLEEALKHAYQQADNLSWPSMQMRRDIGQKLLSKN